MPKAGSVSDYLRNLACSWLPVPSDALTPDQIQPFASMQVAQIPSGTMEVKGEFLSADHPGMSARLPSSSAFVSNERGREFLSQGTSPFGTSNIAFLAASTPSHVLATGQSPSFATLSKNLRQAIGCGDVFSQCVTPADCGNSMYTCDQGKCVPATTHCNVGGCSTGSTCNQQTGLCESNAKKCTTTLQCGTNQFCDTSAGVCRDVAGFCRTDQDCVNYQGINGLMNKCANNACVECVPFQPSTCGKPEYGKDPSKPECALYDNKCQVSCTPVTSSNTTECCDARSISHPLVGFNRKSSCCSVDWNMVWGTEHCWMDQYDTSRNCNNPFGGLPGGDSQCAPMRSCITDPESLNYGKCI